MTVVMRIVVASFVALPAIFIPVTAHASAGSDSAISQVVDRSAWSWRRTLPGAGLPVDEPSQVPPGSLAVAADTDPDGRPAKATYLHIDLAGLATSTVIESLELTLTVNPADDGLDAADVRLVACPLKADFSVGEGVDPATMPPEDCASPAAGRYDAAANGWTFSLTAYAQDWVRDGTANKGIVVRPPVGHALPNGRPFQITFVGAAQVRAEFVGSVPADASPPAPEPGPVALPPVQTDTVLPGTLPSISGGSMPGPQRPLEVPPVADAPPPAVAAVPIAAARPARVLPPARSTTGALWSLAVLVGLMLIGVARVVGNTSGPAAFARLERQRLDRIRLAVPSIAMPKAVPYPLAAHGLQRRHGRRPISSATSDVT